MFTRMFAGWSKQEKRDFWVSLIITMATIAFLHYMIIVFH